MIAFASRLADVGWHLQLHGEASVLADMAPALKRSPVPVMIDHIGRVDAALGLEQPAFRALLTLMEDSKFWIKVSGCDRATRAGPPYADVCSSREYVFVKTIPRSASGKLLRRKLRIGEFEKL